MRRVLPLAQLHGRDRYGFTGRGPRVWEQEHRPRSWRREGRVWRSEVATEDYAPFRGYAACTSRAGRKRAEHEFDRDGCCLWCDVWAEPGVLADFA